MRPGSCNLSSAVLCCASETHRDVAGPVPTEWALEAGLGIADKVLKEETSPSVALFFPASACLAFGGFHGLLWQQIQLCLG